MAVVAAVVVDTDAVAVEDGDEFPYCVFVLGVLGPGPSA